MALINFSIPSFVIVPTTINRDALVNAVQSKLNDASISKESAGQKASLKTLGSKAVGKTNVIVIRQKAGLTLTLDASLPSKFAGWCIAQSDARAFCDDDDTCELPHSILDWVTEKFTL